MSYLTNEEKPSNSTHLVCLKSFALLIDAFKSTRALTIRKLLCVIHCF